MVGDAVAARQRGLSLRLPLRPLTWFIAAPLILLASTPSAGLQGSSQAKEGQHQQTGLSRASSTNAAMPEIEAAKRDLKIIDDGDLLMGVLVDGLAVDTYVYHPSATTKKISYVTDGGRIDFEIPPGSSREFAIRHEGKLFRQRVAPQASDRDLYSGKAQQGLEDVLRFELSPSNAILLTGSVNGSKPLKLIFDTGAATGVLSDEGIAKGARIKEGQQNNLKLGSIAVDRTGLTFIDYRGSLGADGVIGYNSFANKIVAIDYGSRTLRVRDSLPNTNGYKKVRLSWRELNTLVPLSVEAGGKVSEIKALFDTGSKWSLSTQSTDPLAKLLWELPQLGSRTSRKADGTKIGSRVVEIPAITIAGWKMENVQGDAERPSGGSALPFNIVGNDFLKRFDMIIDYKTGDLYLRPNMLATEPYNQVIDMRLVGAGSALVTLALAALTVGWWKRRKRRRVSTESDLIQN